MNELTNFDPNETSPRELINLEELREAREAGWLIEDRDRRRPRYFDGRFLTASDLTRDQNYFKSRQLDLGLIGDPGVVEGLSLVQGGTNTELVVNAGHGVTATGANVVLLEQVTLDVADVSGIQTLDAIFGLEVRPNAPIRNRSGLFVIALRNVEYTANPVATYPKDLQGERKIEDGDIIEATAISMIPFDSVAPSDLDQSGRARLAREIFLRKRATRVPADALPIGVVSLERGVVQWVDQYLVRRDASVDDSLGYSLGPRTVREAYLRQYSAHLLDVIAAVGAGTQFAASDHFDALPPFGPLPVSSIQDDGAQFVEQFFPAEFDVELTLIPEDEIACLQEEAITLPPIDLHARAAVAEDTSLVILIPVPRVDYAVRVAQLEGKLTRSLLTRAERPRARRSITGTLTSRFARRFRRLQKELVDVDKAPWDAAIAALDPGDNLYYMSRRRFSQVSFSVSRFQDFPPESPNPAELFNDQVRQRLVSAGELPDDAGDVNNLLATSRIDFLLRRTTSEVMDGVEQVLSRPQAAEPAEGYKIPDSFVDMYVTGVVAELAYRTRVRLDELVTDSNARRSVIDAGGGVIAAESSAPVRVRAMSVLDVEQVASSRRYSRPLLGDGFAAIQGEALAGTEPEVTALVELHDEDNRRVIAESFRIPELDAAAAQLSGVGLIEFGQELLGYAQTGNLGAIRDMVDLTFGAPQDDEFGPIEGFPGSITAADFSEGKVYHLIHTFAPESLRIRLSDLLNPDTNPKYHQGVLVSMLLMEIVRIGWSLDLTGPDDAENANTLLQSISDWVPGDPLDVETLNTGPLDLDDTAGALNILLQAYESLEVDLQAEGADLDDLTDALSEPDFSPAVTVSFRYLGMAGQTIGLIERFLTPDENDPPADVIASFLSSTIASQANDFLTILGFVAGDVPGFPPSP